MSDENTCQPPLGHDLRAPLPGGMSGAEGEASSGDRLPAEVIRGVDVNLMDEADELALDVSPREASDIELREKFVKWVLILFAVINIGTILLIAAIAVFEQLHAGQMLAIAATRPAATTTQPALPGYVPAAVVTSALLMALIAASAAQVGAIAFAMSKYLFPTANE